MIRFYSLLCSKPIYNARKFNPEEYECTEFQAKKLMYQY